MAPVHWRNKELPLQPFWIISQRCKEPCRSDTTNQSHTEPWEGEEDKGEWKVQPKNPCYLASLIVDRVCACVDAAVFVCRLCELAWSCVGVVGAPWFSGVVILTEGPGRVVYFRPSPCEWRSNQAWDGLSGLSGWGMRGDGNQRHRAGSNHDGRTRARQPHGKRGRDEGNGRKSREDAGE